MPMWMALVTCGFPQRTVLVVYQHQWSVSLQVNCTEELLAIPHLFEALKR